MSVPEVVPRPKSAINGRRADEIDAILATSRTGQAVRIAIDGRVQKGMHAGFILGMVRRGIDPRGRLHVHHDGPDHVIAWLDAEKEGRIDDSSTND